MSKTHAEGTSRAVNRAVVKATLLFSIAALATLVALATMHPHHPASLASVIYGACLFLCALSSFLYTRRASAASNPLLRHLDHAAIFLLIAGTYTPFAGGGITGLFGVSLLTIIWVLALGGVVLRLLIRRGYDRLFVGLYIAIGWIFVTALHDITQRIALQPLVFLGLGAVTYSLGAILFARDIGRWTDPVWHGCVLAAAFLHFLAVLSLVLAA